MTNLHKILLEIVVVELNHIEVHISKFWRRMALPAWHDDGGKAEPPDLDSLLEDERVVPADLLQLTSCSTASGTSG